jgi:hypothetical protein
VEAWEVTATREQLQPVRLLIQLTQQAIRRVSGPFTPFLISDQAGCMIR